MTLQDYLRVLRRSWWVVLSLTVLGALAGLVVTVAATPTYSAQATVYVSVSGDESPTDLSTGQSFATQRAITYADLAETRTVLERAAATLGRGTSVNDLRASVAATAREGTSLIDVGASGSSPEVVVARADAVADALTTEVPLVDALGPTSPVRLSVVQAAETPEAPESPRPRNNLVIGIAVGLVLGVAVVVVADALSTRIRSTTDLPPAPGLVTLTSMPTGPKKRSRHVSRTDARLESFRQLRANLLFGSDVRDTIAVAGVTAASDAQGVARQLAAAFAEIGSNVVVVDVDLRTEDGRRARPGERSDAGPPAPGVADVLGGAAKVDDVVTLVPGEKVFEVPAGRVDASSAQRMSTPAMQKLLDELREPFDYVVLACPPLVERSESAVAAKLAGSALVVVESGVTKRTEFLLALELLAGVRVTSVSVAIDHVREQDLGGGRTARSVPLDEGGQTALPSTSDRSHPSSAL
ncbi:Wzz/FepE/Etk N-terminal domain-containing protein [Geodermatophilus obscurus]|uniref:Lipopolysaccharide biosynthesis protein n=1 Tax=Geodermatophilus obscurus (strain ATCC 25078 / DSM 43160 / JCM 3152 / CCUG 61914 / KCC A-0152 / KCTC 9177 / NBRC 13315 / NRRL B-3577 / G-20) TaxID=526225 RepID=D2S568_GEOOG|nr:Wzz/FepE/Etk N-terminal domain-containing protein [Geodermatophilus obscurus]ADB73179.1 lipopolysaccharide biosynthesis protein [Geodermatophilus obscurus DSM 43160]